MKGDAPPAAAVARAAASQGTRRTVCLCPPLTAEAGSRAVSGGCFAA